MTTGEKIAKHRKENNMTQEQLAELLEVSRQSVSKWESNLAFPETEKLLQLSRLFDCSVDYLLKGELTQPKPAEQKAPARGCLERFFSYEYVSRKKLGKLPLVHITANPKKTANGVFALGWRARGIVSLGLLSLGVFSLGVLSLGLLALGSFALGLLSLGAVSLGGIAVGGVAVGALAIGGVAIGLYSVGGFAAGLYFAYGDHAFGKIAIGFSQANGSVFQSLGARQLSESDKRLIIEALHSVTPAPLRFLAELVRGFL